jgi:hypothetical protein
MAWVVEIYDEFEPELADLHEEVRTEILALGAPFAAVRATIGATPR